MCLSFDDSFQGLLFFNTVSFESKKHMAFNRAFLFLCQFLRVICLNLRVLEGFRCFQKAEAISNCLKCDVQPVELCRFKLEDLNMPCSLT